MIGRLRDIAEATVLLAALPVVIVIQALWDEDC